MALGRAGQAIRACLSPTMDEHGWRLDLAALLDSRLGLALRADEVRATTLRCIGSEMATWMQEARAVRIADLAGLSRQLDGLAAGLAIIAERPLTGRLVVQALGITNQERLRWTKDGRLRQCGSASIKRGQELRIQTYHPDQVSGITHEIVQAWRSEDAAARALKASAA